MTDTTPEINTDEIAHLDFDPEKEPKCEGWRGVRKNEPNAGNDFKCPNPPKVFAIRSCCGQIQRLCLECYNAICMFHTQMWKTNEGRCSHGNHVVQPYTPPFSRVEFL